MLRRSHGWPDANNDEGAPMPGPDWGFMLTLLWAVVATVVAFVAIIH